MKLSRSSILNLLLVAVLLGTVPAAIWRLWHSGDAYLLTESFCADLLARLSGPGRLRFILQPLMAIWLGVRSGRKDARAGLPPFLRALLLQGEYRRRMWRETVDAVRDLIAVAILLDMAAQALIFHEVRPGAALIIGPPLVLVPYALSRGLANRAARRRSQAPAPHAG
jgi:hypothetical protein